MLSITAENTTESGNKTVIEKTFNVTLDTIIHPANETTSAGANTTSSNTTTPVIPSPGELPRQSNDIANTPVSPNGSPAVEPAQQPPQDAAIDVSRGSGGQADQSHTSPSNQQQPKDTASAPESIVPVEQQVLPQAQGQAQSASIGDPSSQNTQAIQEETKRGSEVRQETQPDTQTKQESQEQKTQPEQTTQPEQKTQQELKLTEQTIHTQQKVLPEQKLQETQPEQKAQLDTIQEEPKQTETTTQASTQEVKSETDLKTFTQTEATEEYGIQQPQGSGGKPEARQAPDEYDSEPNANGQPANHDSSPIDETVTDKSTIQNDKSYPQSQQQDTPKVTESDLEGLQQEKSKGVKVANAEQTSINGGSVPESSGNEQNLEQKFVLADPNVGMYTAMWCTILC